MVTGDTPIIKAKLVANQKQIIKGEMYMPCKATPTV